MKTFLVLAVVVAAFAVGVTHAQLRQTKHVLERALEAAPDESDASSAPPCDACSRKPEMAAPPADKVVCPGTVDKPKPDPLAVLSKDACDRDVSSGNEVTQTGDVNSCKAVVKNTWTAHTPGCDAASNSVTQTITVKDETAPEFIEAPLYVMVQVCPSDFDIDTLEKPLVEDSCDPNVTITASSTAIQGCSDAKISWHAVDACGNKATVDQTLIFVDAEPPKITDPVDSSSLLDDVTLNSCSDPMPDEIDLTFTDNCGEEFVVSPTKTDDGGTDCQKKILLNWAGPVDLCGNKAPDVNQTITLADSTPPNITGDTEVNLTCPSDFHLSKLDPVEATDDCTDKVEAMATYHTPVRGCEPVVVTWTVEDLCLNEASMTQTVRFTDDESPTLTGKAPEANLTLKCNEPFPAAPVLSFIDNCGATFEVTAVQTDPMGFDYCAGMTYNRTWAGPTDECRNTAETVTQLITVVDQEPPVLAKPEEKSFVCPRDFSLTEMREPSVLDDCDASVSVSRSSSPVIDCDPVSVAFVATDRCGRSSTQNQTVLFTDTEPPELNGFPPLDKTLKCGDDIDPPQNLTFQDNCGETFIVPFNESKPTGDYCQGNVTTRFWEGPADICENKSPTITQTLTVLDQSAPVLAELTKASFVCPSEFNESLLVKPSASDDCDLDVEVTVKSTALSGCKPVEVTYTATDFCGKVDVATQSVPFTDKEAPVLSGSAPMDETITCGDPPPAVIPLNFTDNCREKFTVQAIVSELKGNLCAATGISYTRTWAGPVDLCGNKAPDVTQTIKVVGNATPTIACPTGDDALIESEKSGSLVHLVNLTGTCVSSDDYTITIDRAICKDCDLSGEVCEGFTYSMEGDSMKVSGTPKSGVIDWTATLSWGCGSVSVNCQVEVANEDENKLYACGGGSRESV